MTCRAARVPTSLPGPPQHLAGADGLYWQKCTVLNRVPERQWVARVVPSALERRNRVTPDERSLESQQVTSADATGANPRNDFYLIDHTIVDNRHATQVTGLYQACVG